MSYFRHKDAAFFKREKEQHENTSWYVALCILTLNSFYDITPKQKKRKKEREKREDRKKRNKTKKRSNRGEWDKLSRFNFENYIK